MVREILGTPRRISLNRREPHSSSRTTSRVQRPPIASCARATAQNWPYPVMTEL
jgi:hypothetical protein